MFDYIIILFKLSGTTFKMKTLAIFLLIAMVMSASAASLEIIEALLEALDRYEERVRIHFL